MMTEMLKMIDLTPLVEALLGVLAAVITVYLIPWIKSKTTATQLAHIRNCVEVAVYAAEKLYGAGNGDEKLAYAQKILKDNYNIALDMDKLKTVIDATIKGMEINETVLVNPLVEGAVTIEDKTEDVPPEV